MPLIDERNEQDQAGTAHAHQATQPQHDQTLILRHDANRQPGENDAQGNDEQRLSQMLRLTWWRLLDANVTYAT